jgi:hypothetical protein
LFELRPSSDREAIPGAKNSDSRYLMGNTFLKNYLSVYDYDQQAVKLGVNIHSENLAKAYRYDEKWLDKKKSIAR